MPIPKYLHKYFWEIDLKKGIPKSHPEYYIKRILELGDKRAINWLFNTFGRKTVKKIAQNLRLSPKTKNFLPYV